MAIPNSLSENFKLETVLAGLEEGFLVIDPSGYYLFANPAARQALQLGEDSLSHATVHQTITQPDLLTLLSREPTKASLGRTEITLPDGRIFSVRAVSIPGIGQAITLHDITQLKELNRIKSDFVNTVSHDLRSPLTAILGYVDLIERVGPVNEQQSEFIQRIQASIQSITTLINDLLDLGRIEAGFDARKEKIAFASLVYYTCDNLKNQAEEKNQQIILDLKDNLPIVLANLTQLRQMIRNLVGNAIKYTQPGGLVRVSAQAESGQVIFQVADNGPGIDLTDQPYIFDKFFRSVSASDEQGTGLGLAIVRTIVENHDGRIWVESVPGRGSTFTVVLPVYEEA